MKKILTLIVMVLLVGIGFSQDKYVTIKSEKDVTAIREAGKGVVYLPAGMSKDEVQDRAKYYTMYFTVDYNPTDGETTIRMEENTERNRAIIRRFFVANDIRSFKVGNQMLDLDQFYETYLK